MYLIKIIRTLPFNLCLMCLLVAIFVPEPMALGIENEVASTLPASGTPSELSPLPGAVVTTPSLINSPAGTLLGANTVADIAQAVAPAVVNIEVVQKFPIPGMGALPFAFQGIPGMQFFFNGHPIQPNQIPGQKNVPGQPPMAQQTNTGSGVIIRHDGYILTNVHVIKGATSIKVKLNDNRIFPGKVIGSDKFSDVAVIKIDANNLPVAQLGTSTGLRPGEFAIAIGNPLGYDHTVTLGIISAVKRQVTDVNGNINFIQTDAAINPGNSGGPLLNLQGQVIGINTAINQRAQNIGFSIPIDIAKTVANDLIANKKITRPWLGIAMAPVDEAMAKSLGLPADSRGVVVGRVLDDSPARAAGLQSGDIIQKIDGHSVATPQDVKDYVQNHQVSDLLHLFLLRNGTPQVVQVNIGQYPEEAISPPTSENEDE